MDPKRVVLAYSGGVDTTACIPYLKEEMGCTSVIAMCADLGQTEDLEQLRDKAFIAGADDAIVVDAKDRFVREFGYPALRANALYEGQYPLSSALGRPLIGQLLAETAIEHGCGAVAHGATAKGNDQIRIELAARLHSPELRVLAPARDWTFTRAETVEYARERGIPLHVTPERPWAVDLNILGRNVEAGLLEDLEWEPTDEVWDLTTVRAGDPGRSLTVDVSFEHGDPIAVDGVALNPLDLISHLNKRVGATGFGRLDIVENRVIGIRSREIYEAPAVLLLIRAHRELEQMALHSGLIDLKFELERRYAREVYNGFWGGPVRTALQEFIDHTQQDLSGTISLRIDGMHASVSARKIPRSMYRHDLATYGPDNGVRSECAEGYLYFHGLEATTWAKLRAENKEGLQQGTASGIRVGNSDTSPIA